MFDADRKEFLKEAVPVHLVLLDQLGAAPAHFVEIDRIRTVSLADLISMKLRSGTTNVLRIQDMADVIGLIRHHGLTGAFARQVDKSLRPEFRKLVKAVEDEK